MKQPAIAARHLTKSFGGKEVIHDCSLSVEQGSLYGVLGRNKELYSELQAPHHFGCKRFIASIWRYER